MLAKERHRKILETLEQNGSVVVSDLAEFFHVTPITIRRDLDVLEQIGLLERIYGGAVLSASHDTGRTKEVKSFFNERMESHFLEKDAIAAEALKLINNNDTVFLGGGTTCAILASKINEARFSRLNVVTNNVAAAEAITSSAVSVYLVGGLYRPNEAYVFGESTMAAVDSYFYDTAFLGAAGLTLEEGISEYYAQVSELAKVVVRKSRKTVVVCGSDKFGVRKFAISTPLMSIHTIITDSRIPREYAEGIRSMDVNLVTVKPDFL